VAVATATLVIAALFNPLRRRVQHLVDRGFNRSRYDAEASSGRSGLSLKRYGTTLAKFAILCYSRCGWR